ncbi:type III secretion system translocon subunit SctE [Pectobacterium versatile]|uniref:type III secretion system translocon subunit SctE n=1 Tax=Pectobacterium versatile TaxID=2488639 RepID=UPI001CD08C28|nr:type III secretion system translocon subunit SctE [Pectobacterium versatile]
MNMQVDGFGTLDYIRGGMEASQEELKRQNDLTKRFGNSALKNHPQLGQVKSAIQVLQPEQLMKVLHNTNQAMSGNGERADLAQQDIPQLALPRGSEEANTGADKRLSTSAEMSALLGKIAQLTNDSSIEKLNAQVQGYNAMMAGTEKAYSELAAQLETQGMQWADDADSLKTAQNQANKLEQNISNAQSSLNKAQGTLSGLERQAAEQDPVPPALEQQIDEARKAVAAAQANLANAKSEHDNFVTGPLAVAIKAENASRSELNTTQAKSKAMVASLSPQQQSIIETQRKERDENTKSLTFLMALISQLLNQSANEDLSASAEFKQKLSEAAAKDAEKKAKEYDEQVRKAEELQKTMGCIAKVLGWAITVVGVVGAAFTGGASLAIAAVGLALAIGDEICQAVNDGYSFMQAALEPLMEHVIKPLMEFMAKMYAQVLESFGLDKNTSELVGQILGAISAAVILIATMMVAGSAASKLGDVVMKKLGGDVAKKAVQSTMQKMMDNVVGQTIKKMSGGLGRGMGMDPAKMAQMAVRMKMATTVASFANTTMQATGNIITADMMVKAAKIRANMINNIALQSMLNEMMDRAVNDYSRRLESVNEIIRNISTVADNQMQAGKFIARKMSAVAG